MYVLYALSLGCFGKVLTELGQSDPPSYLAAAAEGSILHCGGAVGCKFCIVCSVFFFKVGVRCVRAVRTQFGLFW